MFSERKANKRNQNTVIYWTWFPFRKQKNRKTGKQPFTYATETIYFFVHSTAIEAVGTAIPQACSALANASFIASGKQKHHYLQLCHHKAENVALVYSEPSS